MMVRSRKKLPVLSIAVLLLLGGTSQMSSQNGKAEIDPAFSTFWIKFKAAVARNDKSAVADMTRLPFILNSQELDRDGFIQQYSSLFTTKMRRCLPRARPIKDQDAMEIFCGQQIFLFAKVDGVYKFTEIGVND